MIQGALLALSICLIALGIKGFTSSGLPLSGSKTLTGKSARVVGVFCILGGLGLIPLFFLVIWASGIR